MLFDNWFGAVEDALSRVRGFIETLLREQLDSCLSRPRYGRGRAIGNEDAATPLVGHRHGHRKRTLTGGTFGNTEIAVPRARIVGEEGKTSQWKSIRTRNASERFHEEFRATDQDADRSTERGDRRYAVLGAAGVRPDHDAKGRRLAKSRRKAVRSDRTSPV